MSSFWPIRSLDELCQFENGDRGKNYPGRKTFVENGVPFINAGHLENGKIDMGTMNFIPENRYEILGNGKVKKNDLLFCLRGSLGKFAIVENLEKGAIASSLVIVRPGEKLEVRYLARYFESRLCAEMIKKYENGAAQPNLSANSLKRFEIAVPPIEEQKRIVAILDEAFAGIDTAIANTQKNLANARELFESYLNSVFSNSREGWKSVQIGEIAQVKGGKRVPKGYKLKNEPTNHPYISVANFNDIGSVDLDGVRFISDEVFSEISRYTISCKDLYISIAGTIGKAGIVPLALDGANLTENACKLVVDESLTSNKFIYFFSQTKSFKEQALKNTRTAAQPKLALERLKTIQLSIPSLEEQEALINQFNDIWQQSINLENIYRQKLESLGELKQALLHKAFSGELITNRVVPISSATKSPKTDSPAFASHIMAAVYHWHESQNRNKTFGRVKAQKTLHLVEALAGIDMGRKPIKDAAGPNDSQHMRAAEDWSKENGFFEFVQRANGRGYDFKKLSQYNNLIGNALEALEPYKEALQKVVELLLPLNKEEAEILTTVYAAWNNLLLDGVQPTEEAIIYEARENWHSDKLRFARSRFRQAIQTIRSNGIVPTGTGKRVVGQESMF